MRRVGALRGRGGGVADPGGQASALPREQAEQLVGERSVAEGLGVAPGDFVFGDQVHQPNVAVVGKEHRGRGAFSLADTMPATDALVTTTPGVVLVVMVADCVPMLLVGDSAANVILGHPTTLPVPLSFMAEIAGAVRRGAPAAFVVATTSEPPSETRTVCPASGAAPAVSVAVRVVVEP